MARTSLVFTRVVSVIPWALAALGNKWIGFSAFPVCHVHSFNVMNACSVFPCGSKLVIFSYPSSSNLYIYICNIFQLEVEASHAVGAHFLSHFNYKEEGGLLAGVCTK